MPQSTCPAPDARRRALPWPLGVIAALALAAPALAGLPESMPPPPERPRAGKAMPLPSPEARPPFPARRPADPRDAPGSGPPGERHAPAAMPAQELACRAELRALGVRFEERGKLAGEEGCLVEHPIAVTTLGGSVAVAPEAVLNCATAQAVAAFVAEVVAPAAQATFGLPLAAVRHGSAYVCRSRNDGSRMSEHAFGNALDLSAFELRDGRVIEVRAYGPAERDRRDFLRGLRGAACGPFRTVLGPGTDADHADHLHFDLQPRRGGGTYCK